MSQCRGKTNKGDRCKLEAAPDSFYCHHHEPEVEANSESSAEAAAGETEGSTNPFSGPFQGDWSSLDWRNMAIGAAVAVTVMFLFKGARFPGAPRF